MNIFKFKPQFKPPKTEEGFTLMEVLVGILIMTTFVLVGMQAMVIAAAFKLKAQETAEGTLWIQEDLEEIRYQAFQLTGTDADTDGSIDECSPAAEADGFADTLRDQFLASDDLTANDSFTKTSSLFTSKTYTVTRTFTLSSDVPYNVLQIEYDVTNPDGDSVANLYTEVIPDAAFNCI